MALKRNLAQRLGDLTLSTAVKCFQLATFLKVVPFKLVSKRSLKVHLYYKWWRIAGWYGVNIVAYLYAAFQIIGFVYNIGRNGITADSSVHIVYLAMSCLTILFFTPMLLNRGDAVAVLNQMDFMLNMSDRQGCTLGTKKWFRKPFCIFAVNYFTVVLFGLTAPFLSLFFLLNPDGSMYLYSLCPLDWRLPGVFPSFVIIETCIVYWNFSLLCVYFVFWCEIVFQNLIWLDGLMGNQKPELREGGGEASEYDRISGDISNFQCLRVLIIFHNEFSRHFSTGFTGVISFNAVWFIFASFRCYEHMHILMYLLFPSLSFFCIFLISIFYPYITMWEMKSEDLFSLFRNRIACSGLPIPDKRILLRRIRSTRPLRNQLSRFGHTSIGVSRACIEEIYNEVLVTCVTNAVLQESILEFLNR